MHASFKADSFLTKQVTPNTICQEVDDIGFGCDLISIVEVSMSEQTTAIKKRKTRAPGDSDRSIDSLNLSVTSFTDKAGKLKDDLEPEYPGTASATPDKLMKAET